MHGGTSTGPKTPEGRRRVGDATRARWVAGAIADGWQVVPTPLRQAVELLLAKNHSSRNKTAGDLGITNKGLRRVLTGLPSRPEEVETLRRWVRRS